ncbi:MAG: HAD family phosphatase, partial [Erysipelotrichia bacterium]|nr:HAD family phosphatase [Erysipelotrichia bacterium]
MYKLPSKKQIDSIKMIVCDLDGTLLNHHKKISPATIQSLLHLQEKGYTLVLASGRFFYELKEYIAQLKMQEYHGYAVCANGLEVHELATNKVHCFEQLKKSDAIKIIQMAKKRKIICYFNHQDCYYVNVSSFYKVVIDVVKCILYPLHKLMKHHYLLNGLYKLRFNASLEDSINDLHKICFLSTKHKLALFENEINAWQKPFVFYFVSRYTTEITHQSVGKYQALKYICE